MNPDSPPVTTIEITPRRVAIWMACSIATLFFLYLATYGILHFGKTDLGGLYGLFDVGSDSSIPTWFASLILLFCALQLTILAAESRASRDGRAIAWAGLALGFLLMSIDEVAVIHERIGSRLAKNLLGRGLTDGSPWLHYPWIAVGAAASLLIGLAYLRFLIRLPAPIRNLFLIAAVTFLGGALGVEAMNSRYHKLYGGDSSYAILTGVEELLEMTGVAIFFFALITLRPLRVCLNSTAAQPADMRVMDISTAPQNRRPVHAGQV